MASGAICLRVIRRSAIRLFEWMSVVELYCACQLGDVSQHFLSLAALTLPYITADNHATSARTDSLRNGVDSVRRVPRERASSDNERDLQFFDETPRALLARKRDLDDMRAEVISDSCNLLLVHDHLLGTWRTNDHWLKDKRNFPAVAFIDYLANTRAHRHALCIGHVPWKQHLYRVDAHSHCFFNIGDQAVRSVT